MSDTTSNTDTNPADITGELAKLRAENEAFRGAELQRRATMISDNSRRLAALPVQLRELIDTNGAPERVAELISKAEQATKPAAPTIPAPRGNQLAGPETWRTGRHWQDPNHPASDESLIRQGREWAMGRKQGLPY